MDDILKERVPLNAEATVTASTLAQHEERPFHRKPLKNLQFDPSLAVPITALFLVAVFFAAWLRRRHIRRVGSPDSVAAFDPCKGLQIEFPFRDEHQEEASAEAREESCQPH